MRTFIERWVRALHDIGAGEPLTSEAARYAKGLLSAILDRPRIRLLATNPVMLTCLCVVHWNEGELPEGRAGVYREVLRWLIAARSPLREELDFKDWFAWRAFALLALEMMGTERGKRTLFDLEDAVLAVDPVVKREFPELHPEDRRHRARQWLRFEATGSGIIEETAGQRLRFCHLTFQEYLAAL